MTANAISTPTVVPHPLSNGEAMPRDSVELLQEPSGELEQGYLNMAVLFYISFTYWNSGKIHLKKRAFSVFKKKSTLQGFISD